MNQSATSEALAAAIAATEQNPASGEVWDQLDQIADQENVPDEVAKAYRDTLERGLAKDVAPTVADRAVKFFQEWFIDTPDALPELLGSINERYPEIDWAFERLVVLLTSSAKWDELLSLYDRTLSATRDEKKRKRLLDDAARAAKDFADQPDRAVDYLQQLLSLEPGNDKLVTSLERLLERGERWPELLTLWRGRIPQLGTEDARATRAKIAAISLDRLNQPQLALNELRELVEESPGHDEACGHLERIVGLEDAPTEARVEAMNLLRQTYEIVGRAEDVVRVIESALEFVEAEEARTLRRVCGNRLAILGRDEDAIAHYATLLRQDAEDTDARKQLRQLARRADRRDLQVSALVEAAEAAEDDGQRVPLWLEAAGVRHALEDNAGAVELYQQVLASEEAEQTDALAAAHRLNELLAASERSEERLAVLEKLGELEQSPSFHRQILGEAARLAAQLGDHERSLTSWQQIVSGDPSDQEALNAVIDLLTQLEKWEELVAALTTRTEAALSPQARRADLVRKASIQKVQLELPSDAMDTWFEVREEFGEDRECLAALDELMSESSMWKALGELLHGAVTRERDETAKRLGRLANVYRERLEENEFALPLYEQALELDPSDGLAREGMRGLLADESCGRRAANALVRAFERSDEWEPIVELVEPRLALTPDAADRAELLQKSAELHEQRGENATAALSLIARAVPLAAQRRDLRLSMMRLAEQTDSWAEVTEALKQAAAALPDDPEGAAALRRLEASVHEDHLGDAASAFEARQAAGELMPRDVVALRSVAETAARAGRWSDTGNFIAATTQALGRLDGAMFDEIERAAEKLDSWSELADALAASLAERADQMPAELASQLHGRVSGWYQTHCEDVEAATAAAETALELTPDNVKALDRLMKLQRLNPGPGLAQTLSRLDKAADDTYLDALREAAEMASGDEDKARLATVLERLYRKAAALWVAGREATGEYAAPDTTAWALEKLVEALTEGGQRDQAARLLYEATSLPFGAERTAELALRAAGELVQLNKRIRAIDAFRTALSAVPDDIESIRALAVLLEQEEQRAGAVALRERELALTDDVEGRLSLRLANAARAAELEKRSGRVETLSANLADEPGHQATVDALCSILEERGRNEELADMLDQQAGQLEQQEQGDRAGALFARAAVAAEKRLGDRARAIRAHEKVVTLTGANASLDALARLHIENDAPAEAARWLERRLESSAAKERVAVLLKLARTHMQAGHDGLAITTLQTAFAEAPQSAEIRKLLLRLLRQREDWAALASTLTVAVEHAADEATVLAYAREAADLYHDRLEQPEKSVPVLRRGVELAPGDKKLRGMLGQGLRVNGELEEAKALLTQLIEDFGRRGSKDRAAAHTELAKVLNAEGAHDEALAQLDTASKMDADNVLILNTVAEMARAAGKLERAEAALRTMLLTARRLQASGAEVAVGTSEVLFELSSIATERGQKEQAAELAESAIEALAEGDAHAPRLQVKLRDKGEHELLLRLLDARLTYTKSPYRRGQILNEKATVLADNLERPEEALVVVLEAIHSDPGSPVLHEGTRELASSLGKTDGYLETLNECLENARRDTDAIVRCELMLRTGEIYEKEQQDYDTAGDLYAKAMELGVREVDVLRAQARVAGARGDADEQMRVLEQLAGLGEDQAETRAGALYRMAEVQLANEESLEHGMQSLRKALADHSNLERAAAILRRATEQHANNDTLLDSYEQVARDSGDDRILLHYFERRAAHPEATADHVREAVSKARELDELERAEQLMQRAVEIGRAADGGLYAVDWALLGLAERAKDRGDVGDAVKWLDEASEVADPERLFALSSEVAALASEGGGDPKLAAKLFERLRERDPMAREAWQPLVAIYRELGDVESLEAVVRETLDGLQDADDRNALRVELATVLLGDEARADEAIQVLRDALIDDPAHDAALTLLSAHLEKTGNTEELIELLREQLAAAKDRSEPAAVKANAIRLGSLLETFDAADVYRDALSFGDDADLISTLLSTLGEEHDAAERAELVERQLVLTEGDAGAELALSLCDQYAALGDDEGQRRALVLGIERAPGHADVQQRLEAYYRDSGDYAGLGTVLVSTAEACEDPAKKLELLREAAVIHRDQLGDAAKAVVLLGQARDLDPTNAELSIELASSLSATMEHDAALTVLSEGVEATEDEAARMQLLRARATLRAVAGDEVGMVADLEAAYELAPEIIAPDLLNAVDELRGRAALKGDDEVERSATLRCCDLLLAQGDRETASGLLRDWTDNSPRDVDVLNRLCTIDLEDERWDGVALTCSRLVEMLEGEEQITAATMLLDACERLGTPENARPQIEFVWNAQPDNAEMRAQVRRLYELIGAHRELATLLLQEAGSMEDDEEKAGYLRWAGEALLSVGDIEEASNALSQLIELLPDDAGARCLLSDAHTLAGRYDEANALLEDAIANTRRTSPDLCLYHQRKAYLAQAQGDTALQLDSLKKAHHSNRKHGAIAAELADLAEQLGEWDLAVSTLRIIPTIDGDCPITPAQALVRQGRIAFNQGDQKRALLCARRATLADGESEEVKAFLAEIGEA